MNLLQLETIVRKVTTLVDGGLKIDIETQELKPQDAVKLFELKGKVGFMVFKPTRIATEDLVNLPEETTEFKTEKSPAQRLRAVKFIYFTKKGGKKAEFDDWYKKQTNAEIEKWKEKINNL